MYYLFFLSNQFSTSDCGESKGCFRFPESCDSSETCNFLVTYKVSTSDAVEFELSGKGSWVGVGFSEDQKMVNKYED